VELLKSRDLFGLAHLSLRHRIDLTVDAEKNPKTRNGAVKIFSNFRRVAVEVQRTRAER